MDRTGLAWLQSPGRLEPAVTSPSDGRWAALSIGGFADVHGAHGIAVDGGLVEPWDRPSTRSAPRFKPEASEMEMRTGSGVTPPRR